MKVQYTLPVCGTLRIHERGPLTLDDWTFEFHTSDETGYVDRLTVEIRNIEREHWPTIVPLEAPPNSKIPVFPFTRNEQALRFSHFESQFMRLEGYLSVFGVEGFTFSAIQEEWIPEEEDEFNTSLWAGFSLNPGKFDELADPLTTEEIARCIVASNSEDDEAPALAHFRIGNSHLRNHQYIEAIRNLYICIEHLFARGKSSKKETLKEFRRSEVLVTAVRDLFVSSSGSHSFEKIRRRHKEFSNSVDVQAFFEFLFRLRGELQHAARRSLKTWHPSRQDDFQHEAICIHDLAHHVCWRIAVHRMRSVRIRTL